MSLIPFELLSCSWPRPIRQDGDRWVSEPEWDAPPSPYRPRPTWRMIGSEPAWTVDWIDLFRGGVAGLFACEMRGFHVVFRIRALSTGTLVFWDDDGSVIRLGGQIVHDDRSAHPLRRASVRVSAGDVLEVAQWQKDGEWQWAGRAVGTPAATAADVYGPHRDAVGARLGGKAPPLKVFTDGRHPLRAVVAAYSLVLNGYAPRSIHLYGEHQWSPAAARLFAEALPWAEVVPTARVLGTARQLSGVTLESMARRRWFVMKACIALLDDPAEFCLLDDDLFVLDPVDDALEAFRTHDLVYAPDWNHAAAYHRAWSQAFVLKRPPPTGNFNAGLYWARPADERRRLAERMARVHADGCEPFVWEQGFIAAAYAERPAHALSTQRYFFPLFDGMPGGALGYDWAGNPCGFASVHFGGLPGKPDDATMRWIGPAMLERRAAAHARSGEAALALAG